jgi:glucosylglycerate synthase
MGHELLSADAQAELERIGGADLVIGVSTAGPSPSLDGIAGAVRAGLEAHFSGHSAVVVRVDQGAAEESNATLAQALGGVPLVRVRPAHTTGGPLVHLRQDEAARTILAAGQRLGARGIILLNAENASLNADWLRGLGGPLLTEDCGIVLPVYQGGRYEGTLTHALVVPLIRALFGKRLARPLAEEFGCSGKAAAFLLEQNVWDTDLGRNGIEFWIPAAAIAQGLTIGQAALGPRRIPAPAQPAPLGEIVGRTAGSLFAIAERYEMLWLEREGSEAVPCAGPPPEPLPGPVPDPERMLIGFRQGVRDLYPVWERILAPENLSDVLALGESAADEFRFPDRLWARVVYDFLLSYRARVVYRSHVAQSLAPLYLGRVASVICETRTRPPAAVAEVTERLCRVFEEWKPYLVDRWR